MGCEDSITAKGGPVQTNFVGRRVRVCFHDDTSEEVGGVIVRDDGELPLRMIIKLDDGRYLLSTECQWTYASSDASAENTRAF